MCTLVYQVLVCPLEVPGGGPPVDPLHGIAGHEPSDVVVVHPRPDPPRDYLSGPGLGPARPDRKVRQPLGRLGEDRHLAVGLQLGLGLEKPSGVLGCQHDRTQGVHAECVLRKHLVVQVPGLSSPEGDPRTPAVCVSVRSSGGTRSLTCSSGIALGPRSSSRSIAPWWTRSSTDLLPSRSFSSPRRPGAGPSTAGV